MARVVGSRERGFKRGLVGNGEETERKLLNGGERMDSESGV